MLEETTNLFCYERVRQSASAFYQHTLASREMSVHGHHPWQVRLLMTQSHKYYY